MRRDNLNDDQTPNEQQRSRNLESGSPSGSTSMTRGRFRVGGTAILLVDSDGGLVIEGRLDGDGTFEWTGSATLKGTTRFEGDTTQQGPFHIVGNTDVTGTLTTSGATSIGGTLNVTGTTTLAGNTSINGNTTLNGDLHVWGGGEIVAGTTVINSSGHISSGVGLIFNTPSAVFSEDVRVTSKLTVSGVGAATALAVLGNMNVTGDSTVNGAKLFRMEHPTEADMWLQHGSTESPVSGIEYWGDVTLDVHGKATVTLPDYFEALAKPDGRTVLVTARGFVADWTDVVEGAFVIAGTPNGRASWLVKAERFGGDFAVESPIPDQESNSGQ